MARNRMLLEIIGFGLMTTYKDCWLGIRVNNHFWEFIIVFMRELRFLSFGMVVEVLDAMQMVCVFNTVVEI